MKPGADQFSGGREWEGLVWEGRDTALKIGATVSYMLPLMLTTCHLGLVFCRCNFLCQTKFTTHTRDCRLGFTEHYISLTCTESKSTVHQGDCSLLVSVHFLPSCTMVATPSTAFEAPPPTVSLEAVVGLYLRREGGWRDRLVGYLLHYDAILCLNIQVHF